MDAEHSSRGVDIRDAPELYDFLKHGQDCFVFFLFTFYPRKIQFLSGESEFFDRRSTEIAQSIYVKNLIRTIFLTIGTGKSFILQSRYDRFR